MAGPFYVDHSKTGGGNTGADWDNAFLSFWSVPTLAAGEIVYVASSHDETPSSAARTLTANATEHDCAFVYSVTSGTTTYARGAKIESSGTNNDINLTGSLAIFGCDFYTGDDIACTADGDVVHYFYDCGFYPATARRVTANTQGYTIFEKCTFSAVNDGASASAGYLFGSSTINRPVVLLGCTFASFTNRTGANAVLFTCPAEVYASDLSAVPTTCEMTGPAAARVNLIGCKMADGYVVLNGTLAGTTDPYTFSAWHSPPGYGETDRLSRLYEDKSGSIQQSAVVYLNSGATTDDGNGSTQAFSWKMAGSAENTEEMPLVSDWIYVWNDTTGSRNIDVYIGAAETLDNAEVWLECMYMGTSSSEVFTFYTGNRIANATPATISTTGGTWTMPGSEVTSAYYLRCAATVNEKGWIMARVCVSKASLTVYVDPRIVLS